MTNANDPLFPLLVRQTVHQKAHDISPRIGPALRVSEKALVEVHRGTVKCIVDQPDLADLGRRRSA